MATSDKLEVIYDGDCPFCRNIVLKRNLESKGFRIILTDARELTKAQRSDYRKSGYDLNDGMLVYYNQAAYYGHDALLMLLELSRHNNNGIKLFEWFYIKFNRQWLYRILVKVRLWFVKPL